MKNILAGVLYFSDASYSMVPVLYLQDLKWKLWYISCLQMNAKATFETP